MDVKRLAGTLAPVGQPYVSELRIVTCHMRALTPVRQPEGDVEARWTEHNEVVVDELLALPSIVNRYTEVRRTIVHLTYIKNRSNSTKGRIANSSLVSFSWRSE